MTSTFNWDMENDLYETDVDPRPTVIRSERVFRAQTEQRSSASRRNSTARHERRSRRNSHR